MQKRKHTFSIGCLKTVLLVSLMAVLLCALTACSFFGLGNKVTSVTVTAGDGLDYAGTPATYFATLSEQFTLKATLNASAPARTVIEWYKTDADGNEVKVGGGAGVKELVYSIDDITVGTVSFYAVADGVKSGAVTVTVRYGELDRLNIESDTHKIVSGVIRQNAASTQSVELHAAYNDNLSPDSVVTLQWFCREKGAAEWTELFTTDGRVTYTHDGAVAEIEIKAVATCGETSISAAVTLSYVDAFLAVTSVEIETGAPATEENGQYFLINDGSVAKSVTLTASTYPDGTDLTSPVVWQVRTQSGTRTLNTPEREIEFTPVAGENFVTATVDGVTSLHAAIICLSSSERERRAEQLDETFIWRGGVHNYYISDATDLNAVVNYIISQHHTGDASYKDWYLAPSSWKTGGIVEQTSETFGDLMQQAINYSDESGSFYFSYSTQGVKMLEDGTYFGVPTEPCTLEYTVNQLDGVVTYNETEGAKRTELYIDGVTRTAPVTDSNMLFRVVEWGYKPVFDYSAQSQAALSIYKKARAVLLEIIDYSMTELDKVRAIYEWIVTNVDYDYGAAEQPLDAVETLKYNAFYLEGVFNDGRAVCDGKSKAFSLLCGMEGIKAVRITGEATSGGQTAGHAWNKVLVDADGDLDKEWYVVDTTWGDGARTTDNPYVIEELFTYAYLLISDEDISSTHKARSEFNPSATTEFDVFAATELPDSGGVTLYVDETNDLMRLVEYLDSRKYEWVNIEVDPSFAATESGLRLKLASVMALKPYDLLSGGIRNVYWFRRM